METSHSRLRRLLLALVLVVGQLQPLIAGTTGSADKPCDMHAGQQASMDAHAHSLREPATGDSCPHHGAGAGCEIDCADCTMCSTGQTGLLAVLQSARLGGAHWPLPPHQLALGPESPTDLKPPRYL